MSPNYRDFKNAYDWLVVKMEERISKLNWVNYPVWAWHTRDWKHKKPDLRESGNIDCIILGFMVK